MLTLKNQLACAAAVTALLGGIALAAPAYAGTQGSLQVAQDMQDTTTSNPQNSASPDNVPPDMNEKAAPAGSHGKTGKHAAGAGKEHHHGDWMKPENVEARIKSLHDKLKITPDQENQWKDVAQAMRDSAKHTGDLIQERHQNADKMDAIDDLKSYQQIAQSHADGLKKLIDAFDDLYAAMPEDQQRNADVVFGKYEGHDRHGKSKEGAPAGKQ